MKKLFYVEDDQLTRKTFEKRLRATDWEIYTLENMDEFSFRLADFAPDLVLFSSSFISSKKMIDYVETTQIPVGIVGFPDIAKATKCPVFFKPIDIMGLEKSLDDFYHKLKNNS